MWTYIYVRLLGDEITIFFKDCGFSDGLTIVPFDKNDELMNLLSFYSSPLMNTETDMQYIAANAVSLLFEKRITASNGGTQKLNAEKIRNYTDNNFHKKITVQSIADKFFLDKAYAGNLFTAFRGISPKQYIQKLRMRRAKELHEKTVMSISLITHSVGYDDALLFSKMFARYLSVSPRKYRSNPAQVNQEEFDS